jgi:hypothetical protein
VARRGNDDGRWLRAEIHRYRHSLIVIAGFSRADITSFSFVDTGGIIRSKYDIAQPLSQSSSSASDVL